MLLLRNMNGVYRTEEKGGGGDIVNLKDAGIYLPLYDGEIVPSAPWEHFKFTDYNEPIIRAFSIFIGKYTYPKLSSQSDELLMSLE